jgi:two-component sensor histidine kinase
MTDPIRVLYIDDEPGLARLVQKRLSRDGFVVELAGDGESGLARLAQGDIDIVVLDHVMPGLSGLATLERIRERPEAPPVVYATGTEETRVAIAALKAGAADYVIKDIQGDFIDLLRVAIENAVGAAKLRRAKEDAEAEVRAARDRFEALATERAMLLREVNHRVGNSLQIICALLTMQSSASDSDRVKAALADTTGRVLAVAQVHKRLYTSEDVKSVALDLYLEALVEDLRRSTDVGTTCDILLTADPLEVDPDGAIALGIIVNELVLNALKYAYPGGSGPIRIQLRAPPSGPIELSVEDDGVGIGGATTPHSTGLGQRIVDAMGRKLEAEVTFDGRHAGTKVVVTFERPHVAVPSKAAALA